MSDSDVSAWEFRRHLAEHLDAAMAGETFTITRSGRPTARLGPVEERSAEREVEER